MVGRSGDEQLPNVWGLPAGSLILGPARVKGRPGESWEGAVRRSGREKSGVRLRVVRELNHGTTQSCHAARLRPASRSLTAGAVGSPGAGELNRVSRPAQRGRIHETRRGPGKAAHGIALDRAQGVA